MAFCIKRHSKVNCELHIGHMNHYAQLYCVFPTMKGKSHIEHLYCYAQLWCVLWMIGLEVQKAHRIFGWILSLLSHFLSNTWVQTIGCTLLSRLSFEASLSRFWKSIWRYFLHLTETSQEHIGQFKCPICENENYNWIEHRFIPKEANFWGLLTWKPRCRPRHPRAW